MGRQNSSLLNAVFILYIALVCAWLYITGGQFERHTHFVNGIIIATISIFVSYGVLTLWRDLKVFGWEWLKKSWWKFFKSFRNG